MVAPEVSSRHSGAVVSSKGASIYDAPPRHRNNNIHLVVAPTVTEARAEARYAENRGYVFDSSSWAGKRGKILEFTYRKPGNKTLIIMYPIGNDKQAKHDNNSLNYEIVWRDPKTGRVDRTHKNPCAGFTYGIYYKTDDFATFLNRDPSAHNGFQVQYTLSY